MRLRQVLTQTVYVTKELFDYLNHNSVLTRQVNENKMVTGTGYLSKLASAGFAADKFYKEASEVYEEVEENAAFCDPLVYYIPLKEDGENVFQSDYL